MEIFGPHHQLQLLQLRARQAMAERANRGTPDAQSEAADPSTDQLLAPPAEPPDLWQLVPPGLTLHEWQERCLDLWAPRGRGTVKVATGAGKTIFALAAAQRLQNTQARDLRLVIVVPTIPLMFQWFDELGRSNLPPSCIGMMGGGTETPDASRLRVLIGVINSARDRLPEFVASAGWSERLLLVVDECHRANATVARRIFDSKPRYTLGLSATPEQDGESEELPGDEAYAKSPVGEAVGPILYEFTLKQSLASGLLTPFEIWHVGLPLLPAEGAEYGRLSREITELRKGLQSRHRASRSKLAFLPWCQSQAKRGDTAAGDAQRFIGLANNRKRLLYKAAAREQLVMQFLTETAGDAESRAIVFHESIPEIERMFVTALDRGLPAVLEHSQLPDSLRAENISAFRRGYARIIISAKSLVEGFNVPSADLGIIAASSSAVRQRIQTLGRLLRRKAPGRTARVVILYVRDTEDEAIYEKADWNSVIGAERNRYFQWQIDDSGTGSLQEVSEPPRIYRPSCWEIDADSLAAGAPYPAQATGLELQVDQSNNLRTEDGALVPAGAPLVQAILAQNRFRRARRTPAGHLIVRPAATAESAQDWIYLGMCPAPEELASTRIRLQVKQTSGRRVLALQQGSRSRTRFARGPRDARSPGAGRTRDRLLEWVAEQERAAGTAIKAVFWDGRSRYWIEVQGQRTDAPADLGELEFPA